MTACAIEKATVLRAGFTIAADGSYAACLTESGDGGWYPERWTLAGPEPYTVPLPGNQPEEPGTEVLPLPDGRVLIRRLVAERYDLALLYPTGPGTGELPLGSLEGREVRLLPPVAGAAFALVQVEGATQVWLACGSGGGNHSGGPQLLATLPGRCTGGVWLDRAGRMLALDRVGADDGHTKAVAVDLRQGEVTPLLQIAEDSNDRVLLAEPDSGLLLLRSDAPGTDRLGWGVLGSRRPVRFPEALRMDDTVLTPFAAQSGQILMPEGSAVALRAEGPHGASPVVWRPGERTVSWLTAPEGWLAGTGLWSGRGSLRLPYACERWPFGLAEYEAPPAAPAPAVTAAERAAIAAAGPDSGPEPSCEPPGDEARALSVLPLQQAPLAAARAR
ncbi:hypothetical protein QMK19_32350 [Streptomyces sp. H10-C2]|uniref:hypothetical protein n=1 Tax=unclassified Streptomyces TaxID=2593676 RepID=UPI0024BA0D72|nr:MULTISPECIES: hypothetical protein [unclassified Streptomyces]MDJ0346577.1 hypothetical protein [Streptomyces sp. PH10-H1]MDJ0374197.1 hypothetical protein [Streptomyces sp. H10-C2]